MNYERQLRYHLRIFEELCEKSLQAAHFLQECHDMQSPNAPPLMAMGDDDA